MRTLFLTLTVAALMLFGSCIARGETTNTALTFYIVTDQQTEGGRFIDTTNLPKVGYIAAKPDLVVTNLEDVYPEKWPNYAIMGDTNGTHTIVPFHPSPSLAVRLRPDDAKNFTALTERALGRRLLIMLGDHPLSAPKVMAPIKTPAFSIGFASQAELKKTQNDLRKLIR